MFVTLRKHSREKEKSMRNTKQKAKEQRIHRNALRNPKSRIRRSTAGQKITDRPNW